MTEQDQQGTRALDTVKLIAALTVLVGGIAGFYVLGSWPIWGRWLVVLGAFALAVLVAFQSAQGRSFWDFILGSRVELRKVVWRDRDAPPTWQVALLILAVVAFLTLFFWGLDALLLVLTRWLTVRGS
jgi:preprotein translocase subunit SecE